MSDMSSGGLGSDPGASQAKAATKRKHNEDCKKSRPDDPGASEAEAAKKRKHNEACEKSRALIKKDRDSLEASREELHTKIVENEKIRLSLEQDRNGWILAREQREKDKTEAERRIAELEKQVDDQIEQLKKMSACPKFYQDEFGQIDIDMCRNEHAVWSQVNWNDWDWELEKAALEKEIYELTMESTKLTNDMQLLNEMIIYNQE